MSAINIVGPLEIPQNIPSTLAQYTEKTTAHNAAKYTAVGIIFGMFRQEQCLTRCLRQVRTSIVAQSERGHGVSRHGWTRCQQRGVTGVVLDALLAEADRAVPVGGGCEALSLSRSGAAQLRRSGYPAAMLERLGGMAAVMSPNGDVMTVLHAHARRYCRAWN